MIAEFVEPFGRTLKSVILCDGPRVGGREIENERPSPYAKFSGKKSSVKILGVEKMTIRFPHQAFRHISGSVVPGEVIRGSEGSQVTMQFQNFILRKEN